MASGLQSNSEPIEPTRVWTKEEWEAAPPYIHTGSPTGRFKVEHPPFDFGRMPRPGDRVNIRLKNGEVIKFDVET